MFCKNCGREIDPKTLKKLMEQKDGSVVCSKCKQPLDNAEMCGGFWELIAASEEKEAAEAETVNMTVMLDENGKPVQMNPRMQNRSSSAIPDANLRMPENNYSSQNSRQTSGAGMSDSAPYEQKAPEMRIRRSSARKDTELWITRAIAVLLGIALIISLVTRCGKSDQPKDEMTESTEISDVPDNNSDAAVTPSDVSENSQGAPDEEPEAVTEEKEEQAEETSKKEEAQETEDLSVSGDTDTGAASEEVLEGAATGTVIAEKKYNTLKRTIEIDENGWNLQSKVEIIGEDGKSAFITWNSKGDDGSSSEQHVEKVYESEETDTPKKKAVYNYINDYLKSEVRYPDSGKNDSVSYKTLSSKRVRENHTQLQKGSMPDGTDFEYMIVVKTYYADESEVVTNKLEKIEYFKDEKELKADDPVLHIEYTHPQPDQNAQYYYDPSVATDVYSEAEEYSDGSNDIVITGPGYEYDQIRYTYGKVDGQYRLLEMGYYLEDVRTKGPNGFSCFTCTYDGSVRTDSFRDEYGNLFSISAEDPFLSKAVIPAYYSEEFPYLTGRPVPPDASSEDETKGTAGREDKGKTGNKDYDPRPQPSDVYSAPTGQGYN